MDSQTDILELLVKESYITDDDAKAAQDYATAQNASPLEYLQRQGLISQKLIGQAIAESYGLPFADLNLRPPSEEQILKIPETLARKNRVVIVAENDKTVALATDKPPKLNDPELVKALNSRTIKYAYALSSEIDSILDKYRKPLETRFSSIIDQGLKIAPEILDEIIEDALTFRASDIHFEPQSDGVVIRFRVDGVLQIAGKFDQKYFDNVLNRIKVLARLRIDEHFSVQDGAIRYSVNGRAIDMRISVAPTVNGEKVAIRLLNSEISNLTLGDIGLSDSDQTIVGKASKKPFGMILVTGPTGSGKTTSLYSVLKSIKRSEINITTIEDPVEYRIKGVNQIQVNVETGITFADGLRSIVRQDPDVILVGEIRDQETAEISVNAALTGHLLLSTFHANDSATAIPRLLDMDIEPFLLSSTLELIIAQRLVRKICETCRAGIVTNVKDITPILPQASKYFGNQKATLYQGKGCPSCHGVGYKGRTAVFELIPMNVELKEAILHRPSRNEIWQLAKKAGARSLFDDGIDKVKRGITTLEEIMRVVPPSDET